MKAYKTYSTVSETRQVVLSDVPFNAGERVEIVLLTTDESDRAERVRKLKSLLKATQALRQVQTLTEDDILREVESYRNGR